MELWAKFQWTDPQNYPIAKIQGIYWKKGKGVGARGPGNLLWDHSSFNVKRYTRKFSPTLILTCEMKKNDTYGHVKWDGEKPMEPPQNCSKNYRRLIKVRNSRGVLSREENTHWLPSVNFSTLNPYASDIIQTELVIFTNTYVQTYTCMHKIYCTQIQISNQWQSMKKGTTELSEKKERNVGKFRGRKKKGRNANKL